MSAVSKQWFLVLALCLFSEFAVAEDWTTSASGEVTLAIQQNEDGKTPLVPDPGRLEIEMRHSTITPVVNFEALSDSVTIVGQTRGEIRRGGNFDGETGTLDELYAEYAMTPSLFLFVGRRNVAFGQAVAAYSIDVFLEPLEISRSKNFDRRRREVVGEDMAGFELLLTPELSVAGYHLPRQDKHQDGEHSARGLAALSWVLPWEADAKLLALDGERGGVGLAYVQSVGDALLLYAEGMARDGRDRGRISIQNMRVTSTRADSNDYSQYTLGANYTFKNSLALTVEYYHDENGYSEDEWKETANVINSATNPLVLLSLNRELRHVTLRQDYGFIQLSAPQFLELDVVSELATFHSFDDNGGSVSARLETDLWQGTIGLYATSAYGSDNAEFKLRSPNASMMAYYTLPF